ncbi:MAG: NADH-quinone oxidoreductase subunit NuoH [Actinomycetota bacterium]|nr:NADH-quinone oxidoreductase subunit NuoH [Acidimicrobiia bacterium]MDQ3147221.1 NADH-quinone oxidoreductase subunit NuoH [Actinomycetota bacterium]
MGDPLFSDGLDLGVVAFVIVKALIGFLFVLVGVIFMVWFERKVIADMQNRIGPDRAGRWGILQTVADGIKLIFKEDLKPDRADHRVFRLAPYLSVAPAFLTFTIVPVAGVFTGDEDGSIELFGHQTFLQVADPPVGVLFLLAMSSVAVYGVMLAGWSSGSKYPLLGAVRASAQMVSYEAALGLSVVAVVLLTGSLSTHDIVASQAGSALDWNLVRTGLVPFAVFCVAACAELNRPPFDLVEAEQELVGGFHTEYSSIRFGMFFLSEFMNTITMSAIIVTLFLGGPAPLFDLPGPDLLLSPLWFLAKLFLFLFTFVWLRATLPRFRYDQLMDLGWKKAIPLALGWLLLLAAIRIGRDEGWNIAAVLVASLVVIAAAGTALYAAMGVSAANREAASADNQSAGAEVDA